MDAVYIDIYTFSLSLGEFLFQVTIGLRSRTSYTTENSKMKHLTTSFP